MENKKPIFYGNMDNIKCPFCSSIFCNQNDTEIYDQLSIEIYEIIDQDGSAERIEEIICSECGGVSEIKALAEMSDIEYSYFVSEISPPGEPIVKDVPGQLFLWGDIGPETTKLQSK
jgi:hypothetical protein